MVPDIELGTADSPEVTLTLDGSNNLVVQDADGNTIITFQQDETVDFQGGDARGIGALDAEVAVIGQTEHWVGSNETIQSVIDEAAANDNNAVVRLRGDKIYTEDGLTVKSGVHLRGPLGTYNSDTSRAAIKPSADADVMTIQQGAMVSHLTINLQPVSGYSSNVININPADYEDGLNVFDVGMIGNGTNDGERAFNFVDDGTGTAYFSADQVALNGVDYGIWMETDETDSNSYVNANRFTNCRVASGFTSAIHQTRGASGSSLTGNKFEMELQATSSTNPAYRIAGLKNWILSSTFDLDTSNDFVTFTTDSGDNFFRETIQERGSTGAINDSGATNRKLLAGQSIDGTESAATPGFGSWRTPDAGRWTLLTVQARAETDGTNDGDVVLEVDKSGGTSADYTVFIAKAPSGLDSGNEIRGTATVAIPPGGAYQIRNANDPNTGNAIDDVREFVA